MIVFYFAFFNVFNVNITIMDKLSYFAHNMILYKLYLHLNNYIQINI
jgi:hypothetical protein